MSTILNGDPAHYRLAPSSASRWTQCPGSARDDLPDTGGEAARLGTLAHELARDLLAAPEEAEEGELPPYLVQAVHIYVQYVRELYHRYMIQMDRVATVLYETKQVSTIIPEHGGTLDALIWAPPTLHVVDFKSGAYPVRAKDNVQLACYLNLAREIYPEAEEFRGSIVQPRTGEEPIEEVEFSRSQLDRVRLAVIEASASQELVVGDHCRFCPLLTSCPEVERVMRAEAQRAFPELPARGLDDPTTRRLVELMELGPIITALANQARQALLGELTRGGRVSGYKLARTRGKRCWRSETKALHTLTRYYPDLADQLQTQSLKSPAQVEKLIPPRELRALDLVDWPEGTLTIVPDTSYLSEISGDDFGSIPELEGLTAEYR